MRSVLIFAGLLVVSLGGAWVRWTAEPDKIGENEILVMQGKSQDIESISFITEKMEVDIEVKKDSLGSYLWVEYKDTKNPDKPQTKSFKAGKNGDKLLEDLSPFVGIRKLTIEDEKLSEMGLESSSKKLTITRNGNQRVFEIGAESYGTKDYYIKDQQSNEIFLVDDRKFTPLFKARTNLPDRGLWSQKSSEAITATIKFQDKSIDLQHSNWQDKQNAKWTNAAAPEKDNTQLETWLGKFFRLSASRYATEEDKLEELQEMFSVSLAWEDSNTQTLQVYKLNNEWWASSEHTRKKVKLTGNTLASLVDDLPSLIGE